MKRWPWIIAMIVSGLASAFEFRYSETVAGAYDWSIRLAISAAGLGCIAVWPQIGRFVWRLCLRAWERGLPPTPETGEKSDESLWSTMALVRFLLAMVVLNYHVWQVWPMPGWLGWFHNLSPFSAVAGFFIISGVAMNHSYNSQPSGFLMRRVRRVFPLSLTCFALGCVPFMIYGPVVHGETYTDPGGHVIHIIFYAPTDI